jgi:NitT/TauT family transport system substrate-binding protein
VNDERLKSVIAIIATSFELPRVPNPGDIFDHAFLPAKADRVPPGISP